MFGLASGIAGGAYCATRPRTKRARLLETSAALAMCAPVYVVGLLVLLLFGSGLGMVGFLAHIPTAYVSFSDSPTGWAGALLMPWIVLGLPLFGVALRMMRASMTEVLDEDYLRTASAKGLRPFTVVRRHAVPSAVAPVFSLMIVTMPVVVTNLVLIEQVYSIPGVFTGMRRGIATGDFDLLFALTAVAAAFVAIAGLRRGARAHLVGSADASQSRRVSARSWALFAGMSLVWGIPYLFIKVAVDGGMPPAFIAWVRVTLAAAILLVLAKRAGLLPSLRGKGRWLLVYALVEIVVPFPLIAAGEQHVSSGLAAILIAAVPLFIALLAIRFDPEERATGSRLVGLVVGLVGVVVLMGIDVAGDSDELLGAVAILIAALGYAIGPMTLKAKLAELDPRATMGASLLDRRARAHPVRGRRPAGREPGRRRDRLAARARRGLHGAGVRHLRRADRRHRPRPRARHHLRQPGGGGRARRDRARRAPGRGRDRRPAADHRRLVALDRRAAPALPQSSAATRRSNPAGA